MSKQRGSYKRYLFDPNVEIPPSTRNDHKRKRQIFETANSHSNLEMQQPANVISQEASSTIYLDNNTIQNEESANINELEEIDETMYNHNNINDTSDDDISNDLSQILENELTKEDMAAAYLAAFFDGKSTQKSLTNYLELSNIYSSISLPTTFDGLINLLTNKNKFKYEKKWYCSICLKTIDKLESHFQRVCSTCNTRFHMYYYLDLVDQIKSIMNKFKLNDLIYVSQQGELKDIRDGNIYKKLLSSSDGGFIKKQEAFTFLINTDGISICSKSKLTIWPVYLTINELPIESRFAIDNTILAAVSIGEEKPETDVFFNPILMRLKRLELGVELEIENSTKTRKFFVIGGVFDKPAKASILNMISSNGFYGCTKCLQPGESHRQTETSGIQHIYTFMEENPKGPLRNDKDYENDVLSSISTKKIINGVKGRCCLSSLKYYKPISSTCIDYMHSLLEGVVKNFFKYWFSPEFNNSNYNFSIRNYMREIDMRLARITPPRFVPSTPRTLYSYNLWRAHEYLSFILYYAVPVFKDIMKNEYYQHIKKFVLFIEIILAPSIKIEHLKKAEQIIIEFVEEASDLYLPSLMLSGFHELLHLTDCCLDFGSLNSVNCFQYEELNRKLMSFVHGYDLIGEELIKIFLSAQAISNYSNKITNVKLKQYITSRLIFKTCNRKRASQDVSINVLDKVIILNDYKLKEMFISYIGSNLTEIKVCYKLLYNGIFYTSYNNKTKRCDSCIVNKHNRAGLIECFVLHNKSVYIIAKKIVSLFNVYSSTEYPELSSKLINVYISDQFFISEINDIKKIILINAQQEKYYISLFSSSHLFN